LLIVTGLNSTEAV